MTKSSIAFLFVLTSLFGGWQGYAMVNEGFVETEQSAQIVKSESIISANYCHTVHRSSSQKHKNFSSYFQKSQKQVDLPDPITTYIKTPRFIKLRVLRH